MATRRYNAHPQSASGDFYVVYDECISCGAPHAVAPSLIGWAESGDASHSHCIWKRQPETPKEFEEAIDAVLASEVACHRYAGDDPKIIGLLGPLYCDAAPLPIVREASLDPDRALPTFGLVGDRRSTTRLIAALRSIFRRPSS
jgi:hypothetical protein